ncbi:hypothetical protein HMN09_00413300 [Mycena chlorophos]|uniref:AB hydrolase-1 domain-containing protein n=1 Tax=Mycena chlorophos TaxID=658473 RepID=A0A8H6WGG6_MYCCL|nr:hypothetical protein HMN09_00413300 [Mycena chlorophos]
MSSGSRAQAVMRFFRFPKSNHPRNLTPSIAKHSEHRSKNALELHFAPEPARITLKSQPEAVSLRELVLWRCKSLFTKYQPTWWLPNGHMQTVHSVVGDFSAEDQMWYERRLLRLSDGGTLGLDFAPLNPALADDTPIIVVQSGLTGGSHEPYVRAVLAPATAPVDEGGLGFRAIVVNFRGCSGVPVTSPRFYNACGTDDLRQALTYISSRYPNAPLLGLGFSIGANVLIRYLAEEGANSALSAAVTLGNPWNLVQNTLALRESRIGSLYLRGMGAGIKTLLLHHQTAFLANPVSAMALKPLLRMKNPTLFDFDHGYTRLAGEKPPFPFKSVYDYYEFASTHEVVADVRVPCLTINAADDPVVPHVQRPSPRAQDNGFLVSAITKAGGHLGWYTGHDGRRRWSTKPVLEWLELFGRHVVHERRVVSISRDEDGFLREPQWPNLGCTEGGTGIVNGNRPNMLQGF